jgi:hypothetical protein
LVLVGKDEECDAGWEGRADVEHRLEIFEYDGIHTEMAENSTHINETESALLHVWQTR